MTTPLDEACPTARDDHIDDATRTGQMAHAVVAQARNTADRIDRHIGAGQGRAHRVHEHGVAVGRTGRATQQRRVTALQGTGLLHPR